MKKNNNKIKIGQGMVQAGDGEGTCTPGRRSTWEVCKIAGKHSRLRVIREEK